MLKIISKNYLSFKISKLKEYNGGADCLRVLEKKFTYKNPEFVEASKWGRSTWDIEEYVYSFHVLGDEIKFYRGCKTRIEDTLKKFGVPFEFVDFTLVSEPVTIFTKPRFELREEQKEFVKSYTDYVRDAVVKNRIMLANTSFGKTFSSIYLAKELEQVTTVLVHTTFAQKQWINALVNDFGVNKDDIGGAGGVFVGKPKVGKINIGLYHSMSKREINIFFREKTGFLIIDECQLAAINQFTNAITAFRPRYTIAMTAGSKDINGVTQLVRKDGKHFAIFDLCGDVGYRSKDEESNSKIFAQIFSTVTNFKPESYHPSTATTEMSQIKERNILIAKRAVVAIKNGRLVIIFVERKEQAAVLAKFLSKFRVGLLFGAVAPAEIAELDISDKAKEILLNNDPQKSLDDVTEKCLNKELDVVIATQKGEVGLSIETLGHGIVTTPVGNNLERLNQLKGRLERKHKDKRLKLFGEKPTPYLEVIADNYARSINSWTAIKAQYRQYIIKNPYKQETET